MTTTVYMYPYPTAASVYDPNTVRPYSAMPIPPPFHPPPSPPNPQSWIYSEDALWNALALGNQTIIIGAHIQLSPTGKWATSMPPPVTGEINIQSACQGFGQTCIIDGQVGVGVVGYAARMATQLNETDACCIWNNGLFIWAETLQPCFFATHAVFVQCSSRPVLYDLLALSHRA